MGCSVRGSEMINQDVTLRFIGQTIDREGGVTTEFFIEAPGTPGPRHGSKVRHLLARASDGRPIVAMPVPDQMSENDLLALIGGATSLADSERLPFKPKMRIAAQ
jgi:hypothetical protein